MKINVTTPLVDFEGRRMIVDGAPFTLRTVLRNALGGVIPNDTATGDEKLKRFELGLKLSAEEVELTSADIEMCKRLVSVLFAPIVSGQVWMLLEGKADQLPRWNGQEPSDEGGAEKVTLQ